MKTISLLLIVVSISLQLNAQMHSAPTLTNSKGAGIISGNVNETNEKTAMEYVNIILFNASDSSMITGTVTNSKGEFNINNIPNGKYFLQINFMGYQKKTFDIIVNPENNLINLGEINLEPKAVGLSEINVEGEKNYVQYKLDKKVINVDKNLNAKGGTAVDALRDVPAINIDAEGNVTIRGNSNFTVLIDGRPTPLNASDVLRQTPASSIENIEVITNPSVKYDPNGTSGIINIIMKKQTMNGINGIVNAMVGTQENYSADFLLNYRKEKWNFFIGGGYNNRNNPQNSIIDRSDFIGLNMDTTKRIISEFKRKYIPHGYNIKAGADFYINEKNTLSFSQEAGNFGFDRKGMFYHKSWYEPGTNTDYYSVDDKFILDGNYFNSSLNYQKKFAAPGHELNSSIIFSYFDAIRDNYQERKFTDLNWIPTDNGYYKYRTVNNVLRESVTVKTDYTKPISENSTVETGYQGDLNLAKLKYGQDNFNYTTSAWIADSAWSSNYTIDQQVHAIYGTYSNKYKELEYQVGIRGEYLYRSLATNSNQNNSLLELFTLYPSLHLSHPLPMQQTIQLSYSKRVQRPEDWMLNPYPNFNDGQFTSKGNANLLPSNTDAIEINYLKNLKKGNISATAFYRYNTDVISQLFYWDNGTFLTMWDNLGTNITSGAEAMSGLKLSKLFSINVRGACFYDELHVKSSDSTYTNNYNVNYNIQVSPRIDFKTSTSLQVSASYNGPNYFGVGWSEPVFTLDAVVKQDLFKKQLSISLRAGNLTGAKYKVNLNDTRYQIKQIVYPQQFALILNISYKINNYTRSARQGSNVRFEGGL